MVDGFRCIGAVQYVLDRDMLEAIRRYDAVVAEHSSDLLERYGIRADVRNMARALRSMRVTAEYKQADKFKRALLGAEGVSDEVLNRVLNELLDRLRLADKKLAETRSFLSTITTIVRPLTSDKWFDRWTEDQRIDFNVQEARISAKYLMGQQINSVEDLQNWLARVFMFFEEVVVTDERPRPMGTVSRGSIRAYVNNWQEFTRTKSAEIFSQALEQDAMQTNYSFEQKLGRDTFRSEPSYAYDSAPSFENMNFSMMAAPPRRSQVFASEPREFAVRAEAPVAAAPAERKVEMFTVTISPSDGKPVEAVSSWSTKAQLESQVESWLRRRAITWGPTPVNVIFTSNDPEDSFVLKLPNVSTADAAETIIRSVQAF